MTQFKQELKNILKMPMPSQQLALAGLLSSCFKEHKITLIVVGGAAVQYYTNAEYTTNDMDAILYRDTKEIIDSTMNNLGFKRTSSYRHFEHPDFPFVVEFPPSPVEIGSRVISDVNILKFADHEVKVIKVEDIIMDRIIAGIEWKSEESLEQAKLLWEKNKDHIDLMYLKDFAKEEGYSDTLEEIIKE